MERAQIRLSNATIDLEMLGREIGYPRHHNTSVWKCPLGRENDAAGKAKLVVNKEDFKATLAAHPSLMQRVCTVYIQDFLCLGFPLPAECEGGRELEWARGLRDGTSETVGSVGGGRARAQYGAAAGGDELSMGSSLGGKQLGAGKQSGGGRRWPQGKREGKKDVGGRGGQQAAR